MGQNGMKRAHAKVLSVTGVQSDLAFYFFLFSFTLANKSRYSDTKVVEGPAISKVTEFGQNDTSVDW
jgi:hypothetical protein